MKLLYHFLVLLFVTLTRCSLLEMSQSLWTKLLAGGFAKIGPLDPFKVPVIKVDQSEGDTSYRMILRNVEILGLNSSTLESIHIARGRLKSNLSELEAGYVSYSDLRDLDTIRYRFHTLVKEPRGQNESFEAIVAARNADSKFNSSGFASAKYQEGRFERMRQYDPRFSRLQGPRFNQGYRESEEIRQDDSQNKYMSRPYQTQRTFIDSTTDSSYSKPYSGPSKIQDQSEDSQTSTNSGYMPHVHVIYAHSAVNREKFSDISSSSEDEFNCRGNCRKGQNPEYKENYENVRYNPGYRNEGISQQNSGYKGRFNSGYPPSARQDQFKDDKAGDAEGSASENVETKVHQNQAQQNYFGSSGRSQTRYQDSSTGASGNVNSQQDDKPPRTYLEKQPGYIDIIYADNKNNGTVKRFGNARIDHKNSSQATKVYGIDDVMKAIRENTRFIIHNFTEGEALTKRNDAIRTAIEAKRLKDLIRYARNYQEQQGYYEQGMQLIYRYGLDTENSPDSMPSEGRRQKRAHKANVEDDVMHVILRIHVPLLRVKSQYNLMGKVGKQVLRGNGLLIGNFTDLIGDFTVELKKVNESTVIVRAARAKLIAKEKKISLQGMDEAGPVESVLTHGLMAAEAVAAMLADDLATKALSEKTADAMIYRMYQNLPPSQ